MAEIYRTYQRRLYCYRRGWTDEELAALDGISVHGIKVWRYKYGLPKNKPPQSLKGTRQERAVVRTFASDLIRAADNLKEPPKTEQISRFMAEWRDCYRERSAADGYK